MLLPLPASSGVNVVVEGVSSKLEQNIRLFLSIEQQKDHSLLTEGRLQRLHRKATQEIKQALQPYGYYRARVESSLAKQNDGQWLARYQVDAGEPILLSAVDIRLNAEALADESFQIYMSRLPLKVGDSLRHDLYESIKVELLNIAADRGYFDARFETSRIEVNLTDYRAVIILDFDSGKRYRYGAIDVSQSVLKPSLLSRFIRIRTGAAYLTADLVAAQQALNDSNYFHRVEISHGDPVAATHEVPIKIVMTPRKPNLYSLGLGYGTDTGARVRLGWERPRINTRGHRFNSELKLSEIGESLSAAYTIPILNPRTDRLVYSAAMVNETTDSSDSEVKTIGLSLNRSRGEWRENVSLDYQSERFEVSDDNDSINLLLPGLSYSRSWGESAINTLDGLRLDIDFQFASDNLVSDVSLFQTQLGIKMIKRLWPRFRVLTRLRLGAIETDTFDDLPPSIRFFAGGAQSVRGYAYKALGPLDANGDVEGGRYLLVGSIEGEYRLYDDWGLALFLDKGNALTDLNDPLETGVGFGVRWKSPVGPVRIDLASATSRDGDPWRLHINIGPDL